MRLCPMQHLRLSLFIFLFNISTIGLAQARLIVISDVDDTLKHTSSSSKLFTAIRLLHGNGPYKMTKQIYKDLSNNQARFIYLSSSYKEVFNIKEWLQENQFPDGEYIQRDKDSPISQSLFKTKKLRSILKSINIREDDQIILFGDNRYHDWSVYTKILGEFNLEGRIFIRDHYGRSLRKEFVSSPTFTTDILYLSEFELLNSKIIQNNISFITKLEIEALYYHRDILNKNILKMIRNDLKSLYCMNSAKCKKLREDEGLMVYLRYYQTQKLKY